MTAEGTLYSAPGRFRLKDECWWTYRVMSRSAVGLPDTSVSYVERVMITREAGDSGYCYAMGSVTGHQYFRVLEDDLILVSTEAGREEGR